MEKLRGEILMSAGLNQLPMKRYARKNSPLRPVIPSTGDA